EAGVAHQQVEAHRDGAEEQRVEGEQQVVLGHPRPERQRGQQHRRDQRAPADHSSTPSRPKKPRGRMISTTIMIPKMAMATRWGFIQSVSRLWEKRMRARRRTDGNSSRKRR